MAKSEGIKVLGVNKKARFNYTIDESFECGLVLVGTEVKSIKDGRFSFADAYALVENGELWLIDFTSVPTRTMPHSKDSSIV
jgi:SsrA-binding protein